jgi:hypothetical protein
MCQSLKDILVDKDNQWQPLVDKKGKAIDGQATFRMRHFMGDKGKVFDLIVQRSVVQTTNIKIQGIGIKISAGHLLSAKVIF